MRTTRLLLTLAALPITSQAAAAQDFGPPQNLSHDKATPDSIELVDMDGDGDVDIDVVLAETQISWLPNNGDGSYAPHVVVASPLIPRELELADLDGDGDLDVVWNTSQTIEAARNLGTGGFGPIVVLSTDAYLGHDVQVGDFDGNGLPDVAWQSIQGSSTNWIRNLGNFQFGPKIQVASLPTYPSPLAAGDLDADGDSDLVWGVFYAPWLSWVEAAPMAADCNGNGVLDSVELANGTGTDCDGNGKLDECDLGSPLADIDGDGLLDTCFPPPLSADVYSISISNGGKQSFHIHQPSAGPNQLYLMLGTMSGTQPGTQAGTTSVPLNVDSYTLQTALSAGAGPFQGFFGALESSGEPLVAPQLIVPAFRDPSLLGLTMHHAFVTLDGASGALTSASNAVPLELGI